MSRCAYCGAPHERRYACCCPEHTRKMQAWRGACTAGRNRAQRRIMARIHKRELHRQRWRDIAMGRDAPQRLFEVFGVQVTT